MTKVKICGIKSFREVEYINRAKPDFIGFVFAESRRRVDLNKAYLLKTELDPRIQTVGVFVNHDIKDIASLCDKNIIDFVQLHGDEDRDYIRALRKYVHRPIIKAYRVKGGIREICDIIDYPLFDTYDKRQYGGTGETFDLKYIRGINARFFLAGGLNSSNLKAAIEQSKPYCVDISSGAETNGEKDLGKILEIMKIARSENHE
ncbi:MAG: phosphoribosylanthranilate isomerase [Clostridiales bacterium]|jgi:phosphoribosylanthranilate isomerase|nr:phosphoribosylanthranilate isomerase [Clostridiales bacterium]